VAAGRVGLELHLGKLQLLRIRCDGDVKTPAGDVIETAETLTYFGTTVSNDGRVGGELTRRLGAAFSSFSNLRKVWGHTSIGEMRKLELFNATVVPKLLYTLSTVCLNAAERRRLTERITGCSECCVASNTQWSRVCQTTQSGNERAKCCSRKAFCDISC